MLGDKRIPTNGRVPECGGGRGYSLSGSCEQAEHNTRKPHREGRNRRWVAGPTGTADKPRQGEVCRLAEPGTRSECRLPPKACAHLSAGERERDTLRRCRSAPGGCTTAVSGSMFRPDARRIACGPTLSVSVMAESRGPKAASRALYCFPFAASMTSCFTCGFVRPRPSASAIAFSTVQPSIRTRFSAQRPDARTPAAQCR
jgi:hypothetical protein